MTKPHYFPDQFPQSMYVRLLGEVPWERRESTPRSESWQIAPGGELAPYTYGRGRGVRTYVPVHYVPVVREIAEVVEKLTGTCFDGCFLNRYDNARDWLGWHADDSPEMDDERPIPVVSFGAERPIQFRWKSQPEGGMFQYNLGPGSVLVMPAGAQDVLQHRIPKMGIDVGPRVSLTFRGLVRVR